MLLAILAVISLDQTHQAPDFGEVPLRHIQNIIDQLPKRINKICDDLKDPEVQAAIQYNLSIIKDLMIDFEVIPEVTKLFNYLQKEGIDIYFLVNEINKALGIKELEPPNSHAYSTYVKRTDGIAEFFKDSSEVFVDDFIHSLCAEIEKNQIHQST